MESVNYDCINDSSDDSKENLISKNIVPKKEKCKKAGIDFNKELYMHIEDKNINIPKDIKIENYRYFKYYNVNKTKYNYRCKYADKCKVYISFNLENIKNLIDNKKDVNTIIEFQYDNKFTHKQN